MIEEEDVLSYGGQGIANAKVNNYVVGYFLIPKHVKYMLTNLHDKAVRQYPNWIEFTTNYLPIYEDLETDTNYDDDSIKRLIAKKEYYEFKSEYAYGYTWSDTDLENWIDINKELTERNEKAEDRFIDTDFAVKILDDTERGPVPEAQLSSSGIMITADLQARNEPNYCYQIQNPFKETIRNAITYASLFADDVAGVAGAYVCGQSAVLVPFIPWCYKVFSAGANLIAANLDKKLQKEQKWPCRGESCPYR